MFNDRDNHIFQQMKTVKRLLPYQMRRRCYRRETWRQDRWRMLQRLHTILAS